MTTALIEGGTLTASVDARTVSGLLLPYGEVGRTNLGRIMFAAGSVALPEDPMVVTLNDTHSREHPLGRAVQLEATPAGVVATFSVARTPEGDAYLADQAAGRMRSLSAEVRGLVTRGGRAISGALFGAAACETGAFPSATLFASDTGEDPTTTEDDPSTDDAPAGAEGEPNMGDNETAPVVETETETEQPAPLLATKPGSVRKDKAGAQGATLFASLRGKTAQEAATMLAALDVMNQADVLPSQQQQWLGEVYGSRTYVRRFASLIQHADLAGLKALGWKFTAGKTPVVAAYGGAPAQPNSNEVKTEAVELTASRLAGAGSVDRAWIDFPSPEFWAGYFREQTNSYERVLDGIVRDALVAGATAVVGGAVPAGVSTAAAFLVDGALAVLDAERDLPSFAIVGANLYRDLLLTRADDVVAFLTAAIGLEDGSLAGFRIVPSSAAALASKVLVGTRTAATLFELPGSPVRVDAVNIANGQVDRGVFGYHAELINDPSGLALVAAG